MKVKYSSEITNLDNENVIVINHSRQFAVVYVDRTRLVADVLLPELEALRLDAYSPLEGDLRWKVVYRLDIDAPSIRIDEDEKIVELTLDPAYEPLTKDGELYLVHRGTKAVKCKIINCQIQQV